MIRIGIDRLRKVFGEVVALDDVSLTIPAGELFFMLGPSGCGKTTLLRSIAGFCQPDGGHVRFGDRDITDTPAHRRNTGMVFQNYALWPHMTVAQNVGFGLQVRRVGRAERRRRVAEALEIVQMADLANRKPNQMSGGQQQRVALARALVIEPACLLLDEPLSNLDAKLRLEMRSEIRRICKQAKLTAVYVTHDQSEALSIADRIAVLRNGRLEQVGTPAELYEQPANRFVAGFVGETNFIEGELVNDGANGVTVRTAIGELRGKRPSELSDPSRRVVCSIRPEAIRIGAAYGETTNRLTAQVDQTVYLGQMARYELSIGQTRLAACQLHPPSAGQLQQGRVEIGIEPDDIIVLDS